MHLSRADSTNRIRIVSVGATAFFLCAFASQAWVQTFGSYGIQRKADKTKRFVITHTESPKRGRILSGDGKVLAMDQNIYRLNVDSSRIPKSDGFFMDLGQATGISGAEIRELSERKKGSLVWPPTLSEEAKRRLEAVKVKWRADGLSADPTGNRLYPLGESTSSIVGLLGAGTSKGLEKSYATQIRGREGQSRGLVDRSGAFLPMRMEQGGSPKVDGADIELTIDSELQQVAFESVKRAVEKHRAESGVAIVTDPLTGDILAMANWPTFDPESGQGPDGKPADLNPAVMSRFEPGSTMKVFTQAKAIEDGVAPPNWGLTCTGVLKNGPYVIRCDLHGGSRAHGRVDMEKALAASCNVSAATWALSVDYEPYRKFIEDLGFLDPLEIGLPATAVGELPRRNVAQKHDLMCWGFGQSLSATPLQLGAAFSALGNNGTWMKPRLVKSVGGTSIPVKVGRRVFSPETTRRMVPYMEAVFESERGTAHSLRIPGYKIAGKTGTAQRMGRGRGNVSNFVGLVPSVKPKAMILVMIDHPTRGGFYGGVVAGPVFTDIARAVIRKYELKSDSGTQKSMPKPDVEVQVQR